MGSTRAAWVERLFTEYGTALLAFVRRRTRTQHEVADLAQEVYLRLLRVNDVEAVRNPEGYLFTVADNLIREKALLARRQGPSVELTETFNDSLIAETKAPEHAIDLETRGERLATVLAELSPKCKSAVILRYHGGLTYEEVGARLGVSSNMVKKYLAHALEHCRRRMRRWG